MKTVSFKVLSLVIILTAVSLGYTQTESGRDIVVRLKYSNRTNYLIKKGRIMLRTRFLGRWQAGSDRDFICLDIIWSGSLSNSRLRRLFRFTSGPGKGVSFLSIEPEGTKVDVSYTYFPQLKKANLNPASQSQDDFFDTDFTNEDFVGVNIDKYTYKRLGDEAYRGMDCYIIERYAKDLSSAKYYKHKAWISKKHFIIVKEFSYGKDKKLVKRMYARRIKRHAGIWVAHFVRVINISKNHRTTLIISQVVTGRVLNRNDFTPEKMGGALRY